MLPSKPRKAIRPETLLATAPGAKPWDNHVALVGTPDGEIQSWEISSYAIDEAPGMFRAPRVTTSMTVQFLNPIDPPLVPVDRLPIDVDAMIRGVLEKRPRVTAHPFIPMPTYRELRLVGYAVAGRPRVYCAFDAVTREWWVHRAT